MGLVNQIHSPHLLVGDPGIFSDLLRFVQMVKKEWGAESNGKVPHLFIPSKTATLVPAFAEHSDDDDDDYDDDEIKNNLNIYYFNKILFFSILSRA